MKIDIIILDCSTSKINKCLKMLDELRVKHGVSIALFNLSKNVLQELSTSGYEHFVRLPNDFWDYDKVEIGDCDLEVIRDMSSPDNGRAESSKNIFVKEGYRYVRIDPMRILYLKSDGNYLHIYGSSFHYMIRSTQQDFLRNLPKQLFIKVHRSFIVNLAAVSSISSNTIFVGSEQLPVQAEHKKQLLERLNICV